MPLDLSKVNQTLSNGVSGLEGELNSAITAASENATPENLMRMQQAMQKWSMASSLQSNTVKAIGEAMKSTIQNIR